MHVLIVEDDPGLAALYQMMLATKGATATVVCHNFDELFDDIDWPHIDVILCDQKLGSHNGNSILKRVCEEHPSVVRVMLTANVLASQEETYADRLLFKPAETLVILEALGLL